MSLKNFEEQVDYLKELNPDALLADGFEGALVGTGRRFNSPYLAVYNYNKCLRILMERDNMARDDAVEFMEFNVLGAWMGENTPMFIETCTEM